jgi:hypothetical protein
MTGPDHKNHFLAQRLAITAAMQRAVRRAVWEHKQLGNPICILRDGQVVWIPPEEIDVEKPQDD